MHEKARCAIYPLKGQSDPVKRFAVPDDKVDICYLLTLISYDDGLIVSPTVVVHNDR